MTLFERVLTAIISLLALLLLFAMGISAYGLPAIEFGPLDHTYNLTIESQTYPIRHGFSSERNSTAVIESMSADFSSKSITVIIYDNSTATEKRFIIELPRNVINANMTELAGGCTSSFAPNHPPSWTQEHDIVYYIVVIMISKSDTTIYNGSQGGELCDRDTRTLSIEYPTGKSMIHIQGNAMIPEFGLAFSVFMMAIGMVGAAIAITSFLRRNST